MSLLPLEQSPDWQNLPSNVLANILHLSLNNEPVIIPPIIPTLRYRLMHVCRSWTQVLQFSPNCWNKVIFFPVAAKNAQLLLHLANQWILRTSSVPVCIQLDGNFAFANQGASAKRAEEVMFGGGRFCPIENIIIPCASRIISLTCTISTNKAIRAFLSIPAGTFQKLQHLDLVLVNEFDCLASNFDNAEIKTLGAFKRCRALRHVACHLINDIHPFRLNIPWKQLTTIDLATKPILPAVFRTILRRSKCLLQGRFFVQFSASADPGAVTRIKQPKRVQAPTVQKLVLCLLHPSVAPHLLGRIKTPALVDLCIELLEPEVGWVLSCYLPILKSAKILKTLILIPHTPRIGFIHGIDERTCMHRHIPDAEISEFLLAIPTIHELHLSLAISLSIRILDEMADGKYLSQLRKLEMGSRRGLSFCTLEMVQRRNQLITDPRAVCNRSAETSISAYTQPQRITAALSPISTLILHVENEEKNIIDIAVLSMQTHKPAVGIEIEVIGREERLFYHPK